MNAFLKPFLKPLLVENDSVAIHSSPLLANACSGSQWLERVPACTEKQFARLFQSKRAPNVPGT